MKKILVIIAAVIGIALLGWFIMMGVENRAISFEEAIENTAGDIRTEEKRRFDLIPNLVDCVKQYDEHEYNTLKDVIAARSAGGQVANVDEVKAMIAAVAEAYPDLKSQANYQELMNELAITENRIVDYRKLYNKNVTDYKRYVRQFPSKQILGWRGYEVKDYERLEFENTSVDAPKDLFK
jgi:LemA protein